MHTIKTYRGIQSVGQTPCNEMFCENFIYDIPKKIYNTLNIFSMFVYVLVCILQQIDVYSQNFLTFTWSPLAINKYEFLTFQQEQQQ